MDLTLFEKVWQSHVVCPQTTQTPAVLYVDLHLIHEVSSPQAFDQLRTREILVRRPDRCLATLDHATPTLPAAKNGQYPFVTEQAARQVDALRQNCLENNIALHDWDSPYRGIVHVIGPELGATQPGMTVVCGDSHTSTHGAFGALAFGIGTTEVAYVLATQCLLQRKPKTMRIAVDGILKPGVSAKDVILHIIGKIGVGGATGCVIEYCGTTISEMDMEARMTLCNMSIECGARAGMVAPDDCTFEYLQGRPQSPTGKQWSRSVQQWRQLRSDSNARFDHHVEIAAEEIRPTITFGTNPGMVMPVGTPNLPVTSDESSRSLDYMGLTPGAPLLGRSIDIVFIGSCTNGRISDLRVASDILKDRKVAANTRLIVVPGSEWVKREAEKEGLDRVITEAGGEWREPGCSMCIAMNGDTARPGQYVVSTSNRNFEGRQGSGSRTFLASPRTAAVCAITGQVTDPDSYLEKAHGN